MHFSNRPLKIQPASSLTFFIYSLGHVSVNIFQIMPDEIGRGEAMRFLLSLFLSIFLLIGCDEEEPAPASSKPAEREKPIVREEPTQTPELTEEERRELLEDSFQIITDKKVTSLGGGINNYVNLIVFPLQDITYKIISPSGVNADVVGSIEEDPDELIGHYYIPGTASDDIVIEADNGRVKKQITINVMGELNIPNYSTVAASGEQNKIDLSRIGIDRDVEFHLIPGENDILGRIQGNQYFPPDEDSFIDLINLKNMNREDGDPFFHYLTTPVVGVDSNGNSSIGEIRIYPQMDLIALKNNQNVGFENLSLECQGPGEEFNESLKVGRNQIIIDVAGGHPRFNVNSDIISDNVNEKLSFNILHNRIEIYPPSICESDRAVQITLSDKLGNEKNFAINLKSNFRPSINIESRINVAGSAGRLVNRNNTDEYTSINSSIHDSLAENKSNVDADVPPLELTINGGHFPIYIEAKACWSANSPCEAGTLVNLDNGLENCLRTTARSNCRKSRILRERPADGKYNIDGLIYSTAPKTKIVVTDYFGSRAEYLLTQEVANQVMIHNTVLNFANPLSALRLTPGDTEIELDSSNADYFMGDYLPGTYPVNNVLDNSGHNNYSMLFMHIINRNFLNEEFLNETYLDLKYNITNKIGGKVSFFRKAYLPYKVSRIHYDTVEYLLPTNFSTSNINSEVVDIINNSTNSSLGTIGKNILNNYLGSRYSIVGSGYFSEALGRINYGRKYYLGGEYFHKFKVMGGYGSYDLLTGHSSTLFPDSLNGYRYIQDKNNPWLNNTYIGYRNIERVPTNAGDWRYRKGNAYTLMLRFPNLLNSIIPPSDGENITPSDIDNKLASLFYSNRSTYLFDYEFFFNDKDGSPRTGAFPGLSNEEYEEVKSKIHTSRVNGLSFYLGGTFLIQKHEFNLSSDAYNVKPDNQYVGQSLIFEKDIEGVKNVCRSNEWHSFSYHSSRNLATFRHYNEPDVCFEGKTMVSGSYYISNDFKLKRSLTEIEQNFTTSDQTNLISKMNFNTNTLANTSEEDVILFESGDNREFSYGVDCNDDPTNKNVGLYIIRESGNSKFVFNYFPSEKLMRGLENNSTIKIIKNSEEDGDYFSHYLLPVHVKNDDCKAGDLHILKVPTNGGQHNVNFNVTEKLRDIMGSDFDSIVEISDLKFSKGLGGQRNNNVFLYITGTVEQYSNDRGNSQVVEIPFLVKLLFEENESNNSGYSYTELNYQNEFYRKYERIRRYNSPLKVTSPKINLTGGFNNVELLFNVSGSYFPGGSLFPQFSRFSDNYTDVALLRVRNLDGLPDFFRRFETNENHPYEANEYGPFKNYILVDIAESSGRLMKLLVKQPQDDGGYKYFTIYYLRDIRDEL